MKTYVAVVLALAVMAVAVQAVSPIERMRFRAQPAPKPAAAQPAGAPSGAASSSSSASGSAAPSASASASGSGSGSGSASPSGGADAAKAEASKAASTIVNNAKDQAKDIKKGGAAKTPSQLAAEASKYLSVEFDKPAPKDTGSLGVTPSTSYDPTVITHAKKVDAALVGNHRAFVKQHEKDCKGPICPFAGNKKVEATEKK